MTKPGPLGARGELIAISLLILFTELACIRWFPAHVLFLTFFTNTMLLAAFLGVSVGALAARHKRSWMPLSPLILAGAMVLGHGVEAVRAWLEPVLDVGGQDAPQQVFFGTEYYAGDVATFVVPIEVLNGVFFVLVALVFVGLGQELGKALERISSRVQAYSFDIVGSLVGVALFALVSLLELSPVWWFLPIAIGMAYFLRAHHAARWPVRAWPLVLVVGLSTLTSGWIPSEEVETSWSPYYRINFLPEAATIQTNLIGHQTLVATDDRDNSALAYALPHLLHRDAGGKPFGEVLIIGAGSGNDLARALEWGAVHVDAVEIDPVIQRIGRDHHPDQPYADERVTLHLGDGRNFLRKTKKKYDLVLYALVDSLVLHSSASSIRLESYLFTREALADVERVLADDGVFAMYNYFRQGWLVERLRAGLVETFDAEPLMLTLPYRETIEAGSHGGFTMFLGGRTAHIERAFAEHEAYWLGNDALRSTASANGFELTGGDDFIRFGPASLVGVDDSQPVTDDWPFLYLKKPMVPALSIRSALIMGGLALLLLWGIGSRRRLPAVGSPFDGRMFFLGAGFMLIETKAVVQMALLFGNTWMVNSVVFFGVLVTILLANLYVLRVRPRALWPYYVGIMLALLFNVLVPLEAFLGMDRTVQTVLSSALVFLPIVFAGVIFATAFSRTKEADRAFGANIAGAMLGGLTEYASMWLGFRNLLLVAMVFYALSAVVRTRED